MKKTLLIALTVSALGLTTAAFAQTAGPAGLPPQSPVEQKKGHLSKGEMEKMNEAILAKLNLTEDQKTKIEAHRKEMAAKLLEIKKANKGAGKSEEVKEKVKAIREENKAFMKQTLTKDQMKQMARLRREEMQKLRGTQTPAPIGKP